MNNCPCCSGLLLQHIRGSQVYYFCRNCWQTMPSLDSKNYNLSTDLVSSLSRKRLRAELGNAGIALCERKSIG
jgi:hypothetical protein